MSAFHHQFIYVQPNEYNDNSDLKKESSLSVSVGHRYIVAKRMFAFRVAQSSRSYSIYTCLAV
jgi:hypothetical protein